MHQKEIKCKEDCKYFGLRTPIKPCGQCDKNCVYSKLYNHDKELIREFAEKIRYGMWIESLSQSEDDNSPNLYTKDMEKVINNLLKEYGVENE